MIHAPQLMNERLMKTLLITLLSILAALAGRADEAPLTALPPQPTEDRSPAERFANPPASARFLRIIHAQRDKPQEQDKHLLKLAEQGFGGFGQRRL